jgi:hypothetical protein
MTTEKKYLWKKWEENPREMKKKLGIYISESCIYLCKSDI